MASKERPARTVSAQLASRTAISGVRPKRRAFSATLSNRCSLLSVASTLAPGAHSSRWQVLPPGAAQASRMDSPSWGSRNWAASCADASCTELSPSANPGMSSTRRGGSRVMAVATSALKCALQPASVRRLWYCSGLMRDRLQRRVRGGWLRLAAAIVAACPGHCRSIDCQNQSGKASCSGVVSRDSSSAASRW